MELELKMPLFCGGRVELKKEKEKEKEQSESLFIIGGGGGAAKTGIPNEIVVYRIKSGCELEKLYSHSTSPSPVQNMATHPKDPVIACGLDEECGVFQVSTEKITQLTTFTSNFDKNEGGYQKAVAFSKDGKHIATGGTDKFVRVWEKSKEKYEKFQEFDDLKEEPHSVGFNSTDLLLGSSSSKICIWDYKKKQLIHTIESSTIHRSEPFSFRCCSFLEKNENEKEKTILLSVENAKSRKSSSITQYELNGKELLSKKVHDKPLTTISISDDSSYISFGTADGVVAVLSSSNLQRITKKINCHGIAVTFTSLVQTISKKKEETVFLLSGSPDNTCKITEIQVVTSDSKKIFLILFFVILFIAIFMGKILDPI